MKKIYLTLLFIFSFTAFALRYQFGVNGVNTTINAKAPTVYDIKSIRVIKGGGVLKKCDSKGDLSLKVINDKPGTVGNACPEVIKLLKQQVFKTDGDTLVINSMAGNCMGEVTGISYKCMIDNF